MPPHRIRLVLTSQIWEAEPVSVDIGWLVIPCEGKFSMDEFTDEQLTDEIAARFARDPY